MAFVTVCALMIPGNPAATAAPAAFRKSRRSDLVDSFFIFPPKLLRFRSALRGRRHTARQLHNANVAEVDFGPFRLHANVTLLLRRTADAVDELAVHGQLDDAINGDDII